jgi:hypothetical protein
MARPGIVDPRYEARRIGNACWSRGDGPAAAIAIARRSDALNSSHEGSEPSLAYTRSPVQNSSACSRQTRSGFEMIMIVAGWLQ